MAERLERDVSSLLLHMAGEFVGEAARHLEVIGRWSGVELGMEPLDLLKAVRLRTEELEQAMRDFPNPELDMEMVEALASTGTAPSRANTVSSAHWFSA